MYLYFLSNEGWPKTLRSKDIEICCNREYNNLGRLQDNKNLKFPFSSKKALLIIFVYLKD